MRCLAAFEDEMYAWSLHDRRWIYVPRVAGALYGLAIVAEGRHGLIELPLESCSAHRFENIARHADALNARHLRSGSRFFFAAGLKLFIKHPVSKEASS